MARIVIGVWVIFLFGVMPYLSYSTMDRYTEFTIHPLRVYNSSFPHKSNLTKAPFYCRTDTECWDAEEDQWDMHTHVGLRDPEYWRDVYNED